MTDNKTCAFDPCGCPVEAADHCAPTCRLGIGEKAEPCKCGHDLCAATVGTAAIDQQSNRWSGTAT